MDGASDITDRDEAMLAELAELDLALARKVHACAMAAEDPQTVGELARGYQRVARSLRQTLALKARLKRDRAADLRARPRDSALIARRQRDLRHAVRRVIWAEREREEPDDRMDALEDRLFEDAGHEGFGLQPLDDHVAALCADLGLPAASAAGWRALPDPQEDPAFADLLEGLFFEAYPPPARRSSA